METTVSLVQMLDARERRVQYQQELLSQYTSLSSALP